MFIHILVKTDLNYFEAGVEMVGCRPCLKPGKVSAVAFLWS